MSESSPVLRLTIRHVAHNLNRNPNQLKLNLRRSALHFSAQRFIHTRKSDLGFSTTSSLDRHVRVCAASHPEGSTEPRRSLVDQSKQAVSSPSFRVLMANLGSKESRENLDRRVTLEPPAPRGPLVLPDLQWVSLDTFCISFKLDGVGS